MSLNLGPEQRRLFETAAGRMFEEIAARAGVPRDDPLFTGNPEALSLLRDLGLVRLDEESARYLPVDPASVQGAVISPMGQQGALLIAESSQWAQAFAAMTQAFRRSPASQDEPITALSGEHIDRFLQEIVGNAQTELLTAQPETGRSTAGLRRAASRDIAALQRGVSMRTLYQHASRRLRPTRQYVARVSAEGGEVRTLDEFFDRLIVVDREVALIPSPAETSVAIAIRDPAVVAYLVDMFERYWDRARPFTNTERDMLSTIAAEQRAMTIRMLIEGHSDATCAKRMGVSPRTYAAYVSDLKEEHEAQTRFQLGYRMGVAAAKDQGKRSSTG